MNTRNSNHQCSHTSLCLCWCTWRSCALMVLQFMMQLLVLVKLTPMLGPALALVSMLILEPMVLPWFSGASAGQGKVQTCA